MEKPGSVLVVEDDFKFFLLVEAALKNHNVKTQHAANGQEALSLLAGAEKFDLIVIDGLLPDTDAFVLIEKIRRIGLKAPIAFVSACWHDTDSYRRLTKDLGVAMVIHKPILPEIFSQQLSQLLNSEAENLVNMLDEIAVAAADYARQLPAAIYSVSSKIHSLRLQPDNNQLWSQLRLEVHTLYGTSGSYGFELVSRLFGELEGICIELATGTSGKSQALHAAEKVVRALATLPLRPTSNLKKESRLVDRSDVAHKLVVVDDDALMLRRLGMLLSCEGYSVHTFSESTYLMDAIKDIKASLVILDLHMPGVNAFDLCRFIRKTPDMKDIPVLFLTGDQTFDSRKAAAEAGADDYLLKPLQNRDLLSRVRMYLNTGRHAAPASNADLVMANVHYA